MRFIVTTAETIVTRQQYLVKALDEGAAREAFHGGSRRYLEGSEEQVETLELEIISIEPCEEDGDEVNIAG